MAANRWSGTGISGQVKEGKQAEFLVEQCCPWSLVQRIGVHSLAVAQQAAAVLRNAGHRPRVEIRPEWYY